MRKVQSLFLTKSSPASSHTTETVRQQKIDVKKNIKQDRMTTTFHLIAGTTVSVQSHFRFHVAGTFRVKSLLGDRQSPSSAPTQT